MLFLGIKPYKCTYCDKSFIRKRYQIEHESTHTGKDNSTTSSFKSPSNMLSILTRNQTVPLRNVQSNVWPEGGPQEASGYASAGAGESALVGSAVADAGRDAHVAADAPTAGPDHGYAGDDLAAGGGHDGGFRRWVQPAADVMSAWEVFILFIICCRINFSLREKSFKVFKLINKHLTFW